MLEQTKQNRRERFFTRFFPPPAFLRMPSVGIDISDASIKFLEIRPAHTKDPIIFGEEHIDEGGVVGGEIQKPEKLIAGLRAVSSRITPRYVRASLPEQKAYFFTTQVPLGASREQILKVLEFQLEEHVPLRAAEAVVDYDRIMRPGSVHEEHLDVGVTVYPRETVEKYTDAFLRAGFFPLSLEIEAQAIERAVVERGDKGTYMIIDFGETGTGLAVVSHGMLGFTSTLDVAGADLTDIIIKELKVEKKDVAHIKNTVGISGAGEHEALTKKLIEKVEALGEEAKRHHTYWESRSGGDGEETEPIARVILCGGNANLQGLPKYLEHVLKVPVERANVWRNAVSFDDTVPTIPYERSLSYATAIGLALRGTN